MENAVECFGHEALFINPWGERATSALKGLIISEQICLTFISADANIHDL